MGEEAADTVAEAACKFVQVRHVQLHHSALHACKVCGACRKMEIGRVWVADAAADPL
jgi:multimeric flavodoxin WrbA